MAGIPSHSSRPVGQLVMTQDPARHAAVPPAVGQTLPQVLQLPTLVCRSVSQPLAVLPSQSPQPVSQRMIVHAAPAPHAAVA